MIIGFMRSGHGREFAVEARHALHVQPRWRREGESAILPHANAR
jgi:hypothetical protein